MTGVYAGPELMHSLGNALAGNASAAPPPCVKGHARLVHVGPASAAAQPIYPPDLPRVDARLRPLPLLRRTGAAVSATTPGMTVMPRARSLFLVQGAPSGEAFSPGGGHQSIREDEPV